MIPKKEEETDWVIYLIQLKNSQHELLLRNGEFRNIFLFQSHLYQTFFRVSDGFPEFWVAKVRDVQNINLKSIDHRELSLSLWPTCED